MRLVDGQIKKQGYKLWLSAIRRPATKAQLRIAWHAMGQFRYFDPGRWVPTIVGVPNERWSRDYIDEVDSTRGMLGVSRGRFTGTVQGKTRSDPESRLVRRFVAWLGCESEIEQHQLMPDRFKTDMFDASKWRLIEAKLGSGRKTLRSALGQLYDYKRFYRRKPSLGVLVATRPARRCIAYLSDYHVTVVWETPSGQFRDSATGAWSRLRRAHG